MDERVAVSFCVELQYPPSTRVQTVAAAAGADPLSPNHVVEGSPSFCELLAASLAPRQTLRAWVSAVESYAPCEQRRCPTKLPHVLCVLCNVRGENELNVWRGGRAQLSADAQRKQERGRRHQWLPHKIHVSVDVDRWSASVREGHHGNDGDAMDYELTAMVCHIGNSSGNAGDDDEGRLSDSDDEPEEEDALLAQFGIGGGGARHVGLEEGHLVAHVRCPGTRDEESGVVSGARLVKGRRGLSRAAKQARMAAAAAAESYARTQEAFDGSPGVWTNRVVDTPAVRRTMERRDSAGDLPSELELLGISEEGEEGETKRGDGDDDGAEALADAARTPEVSHTLSRLAGMEPAAAACGGKGGDDDDEDEDAEEASARENWVLFNDFVSLHTSQAEPGALYENRKRPVVLLYTCKSLVDGSASDSTSPGLSDLPPSAAAAAAKAAAAAAAAKAAASGGGDTDAAAAEAAAATAHATAMAMAAATAIGDLRSSTEVFFRLCNEPPLRGNQHPYPRQYHRPFEPLDPATELPKPGDIFGIDAEFVALSAPEERVSKTTGRKERLRPSRLGLARVSVVRGSGQNAGTCCIDDYVSAVEPVYDYLTAFSGILSGDLDANRSSKHLTTLKKTYVKLRYLVDRGCTLVGHGLKKDFAMLNLVVPSAQVRDTAVLFRLNDEIAQKEFAGRNRVLSLKFIASWLLGTGNRFQNANNPLGHDSIEDARVALSLYAAYLQLKEKGALESTILEMYRWGRRHGFAPVELQPDGTPKPPSTTS